MGQAEDSVLQVRQLTELKQTKEWERYPNRFRRLYKTLLPENFGKHRVNELATKSEKWNGKPRLECVDGRHPPWKTPVGVLTAPGMPE